MLYSILLTLHSLVRWLVLAAILWATFRVVRGSVRKSPFATVDYRAHQFAVSMLHLQFTIGILLYVISPVIRYFWTHFDEAVHERTLRFFGMEHSSMMFLAVAVISVGSSMMKKRTASREKFRILLIAYSIGILIILVNIPWPFSPFSARPYFRF